MNPKQFFVSIVVPNLEEFQAKKHGMREAFNAFTSAYHVYDHLFATNPAGQTKLAFWNFIAAQCPEFRIVSDVANSFKHLVLKSSHGAIRSLSQVDLGGKIKLEGGGYLMLEEGGFLLREDAEVVVTLDDGTVVTAPGVVEGLVTFLREHYFPV